MITRLGVRSSDPDVRRRQGFVNIGAVMAGLNSTQHMIEQAARDFDALQALVIHNAVFGFLQILTPLFHRISENAGAVWLCVVIIIGTGKVIWLTGLTGGAHVYFAFTAGAFLFFGVKNWRHYVVVVFAVLCVVIGALMFAPERGPIALAAPQFTENLAAMVVVNVIIINVLLFTYALVQTHRAETALAAEVQRADTLLRAILPLPIAQKLKDRPRQLVADRHEAVTIFFADIVGFTKAVQNVAPEALVAWLDTLVKAIDDLAAEHKVEKIKTIGDAYMAASGMRVAPEVGAERVARFAIGFRNLAHAYGDLHGNPLQVRVGIHTGPVVAGVIGGTRFAYDLWGDTVNTASRMESHSAPDKIQISASTRALLSDAFLVQERGVLEVKSLGLVETFWLVDVDGKTDIRTPLEFGDRQESSSSQKAVSAIE
ncbi:MAG: adenylate/guanylate cyclase domain-containing protein [Pseudomonadota bacterium]